MRHLVEATGHFLGVVLMLGVVAFVAGTVCGVMVAVVARILQ